MFNLNLILHSFRSLQDPLLVLAHQKPQKEHSTMMMNILILTIRRMRVKRVSQLEVRNKVIAIAPMAWVVWVEELMNKNFK